MRDVPVWGAVIVAAGRGARFGGDKTLIELGGRPVLARSIDALCSDTRLRTVVVVASDANIEACRRLAAEDCYAGVAMHICLGGETRSASVRAGLAALPVGVTHVAVHDAARALVPPSVVRAVLDAAEADGAAVPVVPLASTLLVAGADGCVAGTLARETAREAQTPQAARRDSLEEAMRAFPDETDESTALFRASTQVTLVAGSGRNIKITTPEDLSLAAALLAVEGLP